MHFVQTMRCDGCWHGGVQKRAGYGSSHGAWGLGSSPGSDVPNVTVLGVSPRAKLQAYVLNMPCQRLGPASTTSKGNRHVALPVTVSPGRETRLKQVQVKRRSVEHGIRDKCCHLTCMMYCW